MTQIQRCKRLSVACGLASLLAGCPYDADVEPRGRRASLRPTVVGAWVCELGEEDSWADLTIGWSDGLYQLTLRIRKPDEGEPRNQQLQAHPLMLATREIWSVTADEPLAEPSQGKYMFVRLERADRQRLELGVLGGPGGDMHGHLDETDPVALARYLSDPESTKPESRLVCRR